jgi:hypothetical protein
MRIACLFLGTGAASRLSVPAIFPSAQFYGLKRKRYCCGCR